MTHYQSKSARPRKDAREYRENARKWRAVFGAASTRARDAFDAIAARANAFQRIDDQSFALWRRLWRSVSRPDFAALRNDPIAEWRALAPQRRLREFDDERQIDLVFFLAQTYVAQTILAVTARFFHLEPTLVEQLLEPTVFAYANDAREILRVDERALDDVALRESATNLEPFAQLYALFFSSPLRRALGEFYTPQPLARFLYARASEIWRERAPGARLPRALDPTCGAGAFLTAALRALRAQGLEPEEAMNYVAGFELSPLAAIAARANLLFAAYGSLDSGARASAVERLIRARKETARDEPTLPITLADALRDEPILPSASRDERKFDLLVGNPPWLAWDKLAPEYRDATKELWRDYGLFTLSGKDARMGGAKKELAGLMVYATIDRRLKPGGIFSFVLPRSLFQSGQSGDGFRRFGRCAPSSLPQSTRGAAGRAPTPFGALELDDFAELSLFSYVTSKASALVGVKDEREQREFVARRWRRSAAPYVGCDEFGELGRALNASCDFGLARPSSSRPGAPFKLIFSGRDAPYVARPDARRSRLDELAGRVMTSSRGGGGYAAKLGANAAGASGVFWLEILEPLDRETIRVRNLASSGRRAVEQIEARLETALVFPLVRWRDVEEFGATSPQTYMLVPQDPTRRRGYDEEFMRARFPLALEYLRRFEAPLRARAAYKRFQGGAPYWSLYNVDESTFARYKVVWRRMDATLRAAVLDSSERALVPQDLLATTSVDSLMEADYLAALLNSTPMRERALAASVPGSKSFGSPGILTVLQPKKFEIENQDDRELAALGAELRIEREQNSNLSARER